MSAVNGTTPLEQRLRAGLSARAEEVDAAPDAWQENQRRVASDSAGRRSRRVALLLAGAAAAAGLGIAAIVVGGYVDRVPTPAGPGPLQTETQPPDQQESDEPDTQPDPGPSAPSQPTSAAPDFFCGGSAIGGGSTMELRTERGLSTVQAVQSGDQVQVVLESDDGGRATSCVELSDGPARLAVSNSTAIGGAVDAGAERVEVVLPGGVTLEAAVGGTVPQGGTVRPFVVELPASETGGLDLSVVQIQAYDAEGELLMDPVAP